MNSTLADLLVSLRNARKANAPYRVVRSSRMNEKVLSLLEREGFLSRVIEQEGGRGFKVVLGESKRKYSLLSRPGHREHASLESLVATYQGTLGTLVLSTHRGVVTGQQALKMGVGGERRFFMQP